MHMRGGCLCGAVRYAINGDALMRGLCLCGTCQTISGGAGNLFIGIAADAFAYTRGAPSTFSLGDGAPTREFCAGCGVHIAARSPKAPGGLIVKVGTLDDPSRFTGPAMVCWASERQAYHLLPDGVPLYATLPGR